MRSIQSHHFTAIFYDIVLLTVGVPCNVAVLATFGRRSVKKGPAIGLILGLATSDMIMCALHSPLELIISCLRVDSMSNTDNTTEDQSGSSCNPSRNSTCNSPITILCRLAIGTRLTSEYSTVLLCALIATNRFCILSKKAKISEGQTRFLVMGVFAFGTFVGTFAVITQEGLTERFETNWDLCLAPLYSNRWFSEGLIWTAMVTLAFILAVNVSIIGHVRKQQRVVHAIHQPQSNTIGSMIIPSISRQSAMHPSQHQCVNNDISLVQTNNCGSNDTCALNASVSSTPDKNHICNPTRVSTSSAASPTSLDLPHNLQWSPIASLTSGERKQLHHLLFMTTASDDITRGNNASHPISSSPAITPQMSCHHASLEPSLSSRAAGMHAKTLAKMILKLLPSTLFFALTWIISILIWRLHQHNYRKMPTSANENAFGSSVNILVAILGDVARINHAVNPVWYAFSSHKFKMEFRTLWKRRRSGHATESFL